MLVFRVGIVRTTVMVSFSMTVIAGAGAHDSLNARRALRQVPRARTRRDYAVRLAERIRCGLSSSAVRQDAVRARSAAW